MSKLSAPDLVKAEPVLVGHFITWLLVQAGAIIVGRYHLLSSTAWSPLASAVEPILSAVVLGVIAMLIRRVVTPAWRWLDHNAPGVADAVLTQAEAQAQRLFPMSTSSSASVTGSSLATTSAAVQSTPGPANVTAPAVPPAESTPAPATQ